MRNIRCLAFLSAALLILVLPVASSAQVSVGVSVRIGPPVLPVYAQPICPGAGYIWTPGYWAYGDDGYYWVPGTWVLAPEPGFLWTPGYWGWGGGLYVWHAGYWGPHVGFYGGINYGFGYGGFGYGGGYWAHGAFFYNRTVNNVNVVNIHNTYNKTVINNVTVNRVSYNGGTGGVAARPTAQEEAAASERHSPATPAQAEHQHFASTNRAQLASVNHGRPEVAATARPGEFTGHGVQSANHPGNSFHPPANGGARAKTEQTAQHSNMKQSNPPKYNKPNNKPNGKGEKQPKGEQHPH